MSHSTNQAAVTREGQILGVETSPGAIREIRTSGATGLGCLNFFTVPAGKAFVIRDVTTSTDGTGSESIAIWPSKGCAGNVMLSLPVPAGGVSAIPLDPGFALASGASISIQGFGGSFARADIFGYLVPASDVPATTPILCGPVVCT